MQIKNKGFTLIEVIIVVVIIGVLAAMAYPRYEVSVEKVRSAEGVNILTSLLGAQKRYSLENGGSYASALNSLDITIPASSNFDTPAVAATDPIATIQRTDGSYSLRISAAGAVDCTDGGSGTICTKMGYTDAG